MALCNCRKRGRKGKINPINVIELKPFYSYLLNESLSHFIDGN
jgi:hypothetical protein